MRLSGQYQQCGSDAAFLSIVAGFAFVASVFLVLAWGILGGLHAMLVDPSYWPIANVGWGMGAISAFLGIWLVRRIFRTMRSFEFDEDTLRYECVGSGRVYCYHRRDVDWIIHYVRSGASEWRIVFIDKKWTRLTVGVENARELIDALIGDSSKPGLAEFLLNGTVFKRNRNGAASPNLPACVPPNSVEP